MRALRIKGEVRNHMVKGKVFVLPTRDKMICRSAHEGLGISRKEHLIAYIDLLVGIIHFIIHLFSKLCFTFCCRMEIIDF